MSNSVKKSMANFQLLTSKIENVAFTNSALHINEDCKKKIDLDYGSIQIKEEDDCLIGMIALKVFVELEVDGKENTKIEYLTVGYFKFDEKNKDVFEKMLKINGLTALYSFARTHIATITALAGIPTINVPMINVYKYIEEKEKRKNESKDDE